MSMQPRPNRRASREGWSSGTTMVAGAAVSGSVAVLAGAAVAPVALGVGAAVAVVAAAKKVASLLTRRRASKETVRQQVQRRNPRVSEATDSELWAELAARHNLRQQGAIQPGPRRQQNQTQYADMKNNAAKFDLKSDKPGLKNSTKWKTMAKWGKAIGKGLLALARKSERFNQAEAAVKNNVVVRNTRKAIGAVKKQGNGRRRRANTRPAVNTQAPQTQNLGQRTPDLAPTAQVGAPQGWKEKQPVAGQQSPGSVGQESKPAVTFSTDQRGGVTIHHGDHIEQHGGSGHIGKIVVKTASGKTSVKGDGVSIGSVDGAAIAIGNKSEATVIGGGGPAIAVGNRAKATSVNTPKK
ncbi:MAG: hypothetical protein HOQ05_07880 [Corynebacteriales bacterium]|nr:hypothetical protein [Mycobacteriales bacterium]